MDRRQFLLRTAGLTLAAAVPSSLVAATRRQPPLPLLIKPTDLLTVCEFRPGEMSEVPMSMDFKEAELPRAYLTDGTVDYNYGTAIIGTKTHEVKGNSVLEAEEKWLTKLDAQAGAILLFAARQNRFFHRRPRRWQRFFLHRHLVRKADLDLQPNWSPLFCQVEDHLVAAHPLIKSEGLFVLAVRERAQLMSFDRDLARRLNTEPFHMWGDHGMGLLDGRLVACGPVTD